MDSTTDQQRIAELPELPRHYRLLVNGTSLEPATPVYAAYQMHSYAIEAQDKYAAPLIERIKELEKQNAELFDTLRHIVHNVKATGKRLDLGIAMTRAEATIAATNQGGQQK